MLQRQTTEPDPVPVQNKKYYTTPTLEAFGDMRDLTLGPTPGSGESGGHTTFRPKTSPGRP